MNDMIRIINDNGTYRWSGDTLLRLFHFFVCKKMFWTKLDIGNWKSILNFLFKFEKNKSQQTGDANILVVIFNEVKI